MYQILEQEIRNGQVSGENSGQINHIIYCDALSIILNFVLNGLEQIRNRLFQKDDIVPRKTIITEILKTTSQKEQTMEIMPSNALI